MRISYSALSTYRQCPQKYKFQEVEKRKAPKSKEAVFGTTVHSALKYMFSKDPIFPTLEEVTARFRDALSASETIKEEEKSRFLESGEKMIRNFYRKNPPWNFNVIDLESRFEALIEDKPKGKSHILVGIIDRIDKKEDTNTYEIIDYKTSRKLPSQETVNQDLQLSVYHLGLLKRWPHLKPQNIRLSLYFLKAGEKLTTMMSEETLKKTETQLLSQLRELENKIEKNDFPPSPSALCNWCGYKSICPAWRHLYERDIKPLPEKAEIDNIIERYSELKKEIAARDAELKKLASEINHYLDETGLERIFGDSNVIARKTQERSSFDIEKLKSVLEPAGLWHTILAPDQKKLKAVLPSLPDELKEKIIETLIIKKIKSLALSKREKE